MPVDLAEELHAINRRVRFWLESLSQNPAEAHAATPEQMNGLLSELMQAGARLRCLVQGENPPLDREVAEYRSQVQRLRALLPSIHETLLREKARLEQARSRLASAKHWAGVSRQTL